MKVIDRNERFVILLWRC